MTKRSSLASYKLEDGHIVIVGDGQLTRTIGVEPFQQGADPDAVVHRLRILADMIEASAAAMRPGSPERKP